MPHQLHVLDVAHTDCMHVDVSDVQHCIAAIVLST